MERVSDLLRLVLVLSFVVAQFPPDDGAAEFDAADGNRSRRDGDVRRRDMLAPVTSSVATWGPLLMRGWNGMLTDRRHVPGTRAQHRRFLRATRKAQPAKDANWAKAVAGPAVGGPLVVGHAGKLARRSKASSATDSGTGSGRQLAGSRCRR